MADIRIMVVDDEEHIGFLLKAKLEREGYVVHWYLNGHDALEHVHEINPHLIVTDVMLPGLTGMEVLERLQADDALRDIPVIMLSGLGKEEDIVKGIEMGAADYMVKPFRPAELVARVKRLLARQG